MQTRDIAIILLIGLLCINIVSTFPPYTTNQFIDQTTDLNHQHFLDKNYDGYLVIIDENTLSIADENILLTSPNSTIWNCGVTNDGVFQCS
jgi:hypothetical protein